MPDDDGQGQGSDQGQGSEGQQDQQGKQGQGAKDDPSKWDPERAKATILAQRDSEKDLQRQLTAAQAKITEFEQSQLTEQQRTTAKLAETERTLLAAQQELNDAKIEREVERAAARLGFIDPEDAVLQVNRSLLKVDDDGRPTTESLEAALTDLAGRKAHLLGSSRGSWDGGNRGSATQPAPDMNAAMRRAAGFSS